MNDDRLRDDRHGLTGVQTGAATGTATRTAPWTGRLDFAIYGDSGWRVGVVELIVRLDSVDVWCGNSHYGTVSRDELRVWFAHDDADLLTDACAWTTRPTGVALSLAGFLPYPVPDHVTTFLASHL